MDSKQNWRMTLQRSQVNKVLRKMKSGRATGNRQVTGRSVDEFEKN